MNGSGLDLNDALPADLTGQPGRGGSFRRGVLSLGSGSAISLAVLLAEAVIVARALPAADMGAYALFQTILNLLINIPDLGFRTTAAQFIGAAYATLISQVVVMPLAWWCLRREGLPTFTWLHVRHGFLAAALLALYFVLPPLGFGLRVALLAAFPLLFSLVSARDLAALVPKCYRPARRPWGRTAVEGERAMKRIALGWVDYHTRTASLSRALDLKPYFIWRLGRVRRWLLPIKYLWQAMDTVGILIRERPDVILVQTPPIFVALIACLYAVGRRCQVILDAHSATFLSPKWRWSMSLHRWCSRHAQITLVHAPTLAPLLEEWSVPTMTLGHCAIDPGLCEPPGGGGERGDGIRTAARPAASRAISESSPVEGDFTLAVPCSFNEDEPIDSILDAAAQLPGVRFLITGNDRRLPPQLAARRPGNVTFTGFLPLPAYFELLRSVDAVLVLTTDPDTIQHGGVEAVWLERPVITSGSLALRQVFHQGTVFVDNTPAGIRAGVLSARQNLEQLKAGVAVLRREFERDWQAKCSYLRVITGGGLPASPPSGLEVVDCAPGVEHRP